MNLDVDLEERIKFWTKVWSKIPTVKRTKKSKTWKNPKSYMKIESGQDSNTKQEL
jgi:hypothetical protein